MVIVVSYTSLILLFDKFLLLYSLIHLQKILVIIILTIVFILFLTSISHTLSHKLRELIIDEHSRDATQHFLSDRRILLR